MTAFVTPCTTVSTNGATWWRCEKISAEMTPSQFDVELAAWRKENPKYQFSDGRRCGWTVLQYVASLGNFRLVEHIVKLGGKELCEIGNDGRCTPLYEAVEKGHYWAAKKLIELGADPNLATAVCFSGKYHTGESPLATALRMKHLSIAKLLLSSSAVAEPTPVSEAKEMLVEADRARHRDRTALIEALTQATEAVQTPVALLDIVADFHGHYDADVEGAAAYYAEDMPPPVHEEPKEHDEEERPEAASGSIKCAVM